MSESFWWTALAIATISAIGHLATMLGTRWGDRRASFKALLFSLLAHASLLCALFAVGPKIERLALARQTEPELEAPSEPIELREVLSDADEPVPLDEDGNVPLWDRPSERVATPEERTDRPVELPAAAETERTVEPLASIDRDIPPIEELPEMQESVPDASAVETPQLSAGSPELTIDEETAEARAEERPPIARADRSPLAEAGEEESVDRTALPAAADRVRPEFDPRKQLADLRGAEAPESLPEVTSPEEPLKIERPTAPLPLPSEEIAGAGEQGEGARGDAALSERFSPRSTRSQDFAGDLPVQERRIGEADSPVTSAPSRQELARIGVDGPRPATELPRLSRPDAAPLRGQRAGVPETYQLRQLEGRSDVARRHGGTEGSEQAVERSLKWLADRQRPEGYWDADAHGAGQIAVDEEGVNRDYAGKTADSGVTALAVLAFLGAGYTHEEGEYAEAVERALTWLIANQRDDGFLGGEAAHFEQMYCHGMATYAIAEAYGMQKDKTGSRLRRPLERAVLYIAAMQHRDGGWRYEKGQPGDMSMFGWQLMALKSAEIAGVPMPGSTRAKMIQFLKDRSLGESGGLAAYRKTDPQIPATPSMTAEALFCKQILGMTRTNPASVEGVSYLLKNAPKRSELNYYYWYYGTLAVFQYGGPAWERWNASLRDLLIAEQVKDGEDAGSWPPRDAWGPYGGRVYSTAVATLSLEVYYRFLPLYRATENPADDAADE